MPGTMPEISAARAELEVATAKLIAAASTGEHGSAIDLSSRPPRA
ncbi:hypothetical protein [Granulicella arctica]|nr:hypothetical protein [Granulicella arctica]